jgi:hypothetical protein
MREKAKSNQQEPIFDPNHEAAIFLQAFAEVFFST